MTTPEGLRRWLTVKQAAEYLGLSVKGVYDMAAAGKLPVARIGRVVRIDLQALEANLNAQVQGRPTPSWTKGAR